MRYRKKRKLMVRGDRLMSVAKATDMKFKKAVCKSKKKLKRIK